MPLSKSWLSASSFNNAKTLQPLTIHGFMAKLMPISLRRSGAMTQRLHNFILFRTAKVRVRAGTHKSLPVGTPLVRDRPFVSMRRPGKSKQDWWNPRKPQLVVFCLFVCLFVCFGITLDTQRRRLRASKTVTNCCNARLTYWGSQQFKFVNAIFMKVLYACAEDHKMANSFLPYQDCVHMLA